MTAVDTNVLVYTHDPRDLGKQDKSVEIIASLADGVLLSQVACEYLAAGRNLAAYGMSPRQAYADLRRLRQVWAPALPSWAVMGRAERLMDSGNLSLWDALIIAACLDAGVGAASTRRTSTLRPRL